MTSFRSSLTFAAGLLASALTFAQSPIATPGQTQTPAAAAPTEAPTKTVADVSSGGKVAYYGRKFDGRKTASGERFNSRALTMAHKSLPMGTMVRVTILSNRRAVLVRVNDRGPSTPDRVGDLSFAAASKLKMLRSGVIEAKLETVGGPKSRSTSKRA